jgi:hypothetical protein
MKSDAAFVLCLFFLMLALVRVVHAADETFAAEFLGSPLLVLVAVFVIAALASLYHRMRK